MDSPKYGSYGYDGVDEAQRQTDQRRKPKTFWLYQPKKHGRVHEKQIIFLEDRPFTCWVHEVTINGEFGNIFPCNKGIWEDKSCVMCQNRLEPYYVGFYSIIDCSEFRTDEGKVLKNFRRILPAKLGTIKLLMQKIKTYGGLAFKRWNVSRTSDTSAKVGNVYDFIRDEEVETDPKTGIKVLADRQYWWKDREGLQHAPEPFKYTEVYPALRNEELANIIGLDMPDDARHGDVFDRQIANRDRENQRGYEGQQPAPPDSPHHDPKDPVSYA